MSSSIEPGDYVSFQVPNSYGRQEPTYNIGLVVGITPGGFWRPSEVSIACNGKIYNRSVIDCIKCNKNLISIVAKQFESMFNKSITQSALEIDTNE